MTKKSPRSAQEIVDAQVQRWNAERQRSGASAHRPVITVSHRYGAAGAAFACGLADLLGFTCWDRQLLDEIARQSGAPAALLASLDEHHRGVIAEIVDAFDLQRRVSRPDYFRGLVRSVHAIAHHGSAVIVGRGAQFVLGPDEALRILVIRPLDDRIAEVMARDDVTESEARDRLRTVDEDRRKFIRDYFDRDNADPLAYDLVVNTGTMPMERAIAAAAAGYRARFSISALAGQAE